MSKLLLGGIKGCERKTYSWHSNGFPMVVTLGQQYYVGDKPTVILYTYINRHAGTPDQCCRKTPFNREINVAFFAGPHYLG